MEAVNAGHITDWRGRDLSGYVGQLQFNETGVLCDGCVLIPANEFEI